MDDASETLDVLLAAILSLHELRREQWESDGGAKYADLTEDEIRWIVSELWVDRYTESRKKFEEAVGKVMNDYLARS